MYLTDATLMLLLAARIHGTDEAVRASAKTVIKKLPRSKRDSTSSSRACSKLQAIAVAEDEVFTSCLDCLELAIGEAGCVSRHGGYLQHRFGILKIAFGSSGYHLGYQSAWNSEILQSPKKS